MGFVNINGQQLHTSNISTTGPTGSSGQQNSSISISGGSITTTTGSNNNLVYSSSSGSFVISSPKTTYFILGEEFETESYWTDSSLALIISSINIMGKPFYDDLKKQGVVLPEDIDDFINERFKIIERDKKIEDIITNKS